jgi:hypothetical protein
MKNPKFDPRRYSEVEEILAGIGLVKRVSGNNTMYCHESGGTITLYRTGSTNIQGSDEGKEIIYSIWLEHCEQLQVATTSQRQNHSLVYYVKEDEIDDTRRNIIHFLSSEGFSVEEKRVPNASYALTVTDAENNKVMITQYTRKTIMGVKLLLQGVESSLWNYLVEFIGNLLNATFETEIAKVKVTVESDKEIDVLAVVTSEEKENATNTSRDKLGDCFAFLSNHDQDLIESSEFLFQTALPVKNYFAFVSGTIRAFEGYFKKVLVELGAYTRKQVVEDRNWDFGSVIVERTPIRLSLAITERLSKEQTLRNRQTGIIEKLVKAIFDYRHPSFHNPSYRNYPNIEAARTVHEELLRLMRSSYELLRSELN